jgi:hypothetical protein
VLGQLIGWLSDFFAVRAPNQETATQFGLRAAMACAIVVPLLSFVLQLILSKLAPHRRAAAPGSGRL